MKMKTGSGEILESLATITFPSLAVVFLLRLIKIVVIPVLL